MVALEGDCAWVETQRRSACGNCLAEHGCGTGALAGFFAQRRARVRALNRPGARVGDAVVVGLREDALVRGSLAMYLLPVLALLGGGLAGEALAGAAGLVARDGAAVVAGLLGLAAGLLGVRRYAQRVPGDERYQPVVLRRVGSALPVRATGGTPPAA